MKDVGVIFRREMGAYFHSPIAYIFIVVFLFLTSGFYTNGFFLAGVADMRDFFGTLPLYLLFFIPALTMRLWAEDQRLGTFELLMTLPMKPWHIVLGKYLAGLAFYAIALACTFTIPISLMWIGHPDLGAIACGYFGSLLLGALFLAIGIFVSGLFRDQIAAFILTLLACAFFVLAGTQFFVAILDGWVDGLGSFLSSAFAVNLRFEGIERGVIGLDDVLFFLSFSIVFLVLNTLSLEGRKY
ncbi:MAG: ABC transporter permease subunit [Gemmatimonadetes bacterium]|nr:ABC transporter permease subunit [Gemmatimonadota bacterium]